jgi:quaternary ammonium compound-resistance protein SugE
MAWLILVIAGLFEVAFTTCLNLSDSFKRPWWTAGFLISITLSFWLFDKGARAISFGTAYAVWTGIGAAGTVLVGIFFFKEPVNFWRLFFIFTLISSILGLKFVSK